jgi:hypothetical protein
MLSKTDYVILTVIFSKQKQILNPASFGCKVFSPLTTFAYHFLKIMICSL